MHNISINPLWFLAIAVIFFAAGMLTRTSQLRKSRKKLLSLENEMLKSHAEILKLQQDLVALNESLPDTKTPVVSIKEASSDESNNATDSGSRKRFK